MSEIRLLRAQALSACLGCLGLAVACGEVGSMAMPLVPDICHPSDSALRTLNARCGPSFPGRFTGNDKPCSTEVDGGEQPPNGRFDARYTIDEQGNTLSGVTKYEYTPEGNVLHAKLRETIFRRDSRVEYAYADGALSSAVVFEEGLATAEISFEMIDGRLIRDMMADGYEIRSIWEGNRLVRQEEHYPGLENNPGYDPTLKSYVYDDAGRLSEERFHRRGVGSVLESHTYFYDDDGHVAEQESEYDSKPSERIRFEYDGNRLTSSTLESADEGTVKSISTYFYDCEN